MRRKKMLEYIDSLNSQNIALRARVSVLEAENKKNQSAIRRTVDALECLAKVVHRNDCNE